MMGLTNNRVLYIFTLMLFTGCLLYPQASSANAPKAVTLTYDSASQMLSVTITHQSPFPSFHYIKHVEIKKNGNVLNNNTYENQPDQSPFTYSYKIPAIAGDAIEVTARCSLYGSRTSNLTVGK